MKTITLDARRAAHELTCHVRVIHAREMSTRFAIGRWLIKLAGEIMTARVVIELESPKIKRVAKWARTAI
jgi:hypothetical protein